MRYWVMKSEPGEFSIDDLERVGTELWDGIRNYQVRNWFRDEFAIGDKALFYHSNVQPPGVVGEMEVVKDAYPDPTQFDAADKHHDASADRANPRWLAVDVAFVARFPQMVTLDDLRNDSQFQDLPLVRKGNRLSVAPLTCAQYQAIRTQGGL